MKRFNERLHHIIKSMVAQLLVILMIMISVIGTSSATANAASVPKLTKTTLNILAGKQFDLNISNKIKHSTYHWSSSNINIATVSQKGTVKGVSKGETTITCKVNTLIKKYKLTCKVTVSEPAVSPTPEPTPAASDTSSGTVIEGDKTSNELVKEMGNGWNLGNTMEAVAAWLPSTATAMDYEKAWGQPTTTKEMITGLKASGFNSVRIPVAWSNLMSADGSYTISADYFNRVDEIIGYVLDNDMYAIVNIHWDGGWWDNFGSADQSVRKQAMDKYKAIWTQIASHYADYSNHLIFESANEELGNFKNAFSTNDAYAKVNEINQNFVDTVRASGGNNPTRYLLIAGFNTDIDKTCSSKFIMPKDTVKYHLMISVHYYTPSTFCIAGETNNSWGYMDSWGSDSDKNLMKTNFKKMQKFSDAGYGVIIGEYGVTQKKVKDTWVTKSGTDKFLQSVVTLAKEYNYCSMLWDTGSYYDRNSCKFKDEGIASIYK